MECFLVRRKGTENMTKKVGIVVLNYNTAGLTIDLVNKCLNIKTIDLIVVVDNASDFKDCSNLRMFENENPNEKVKFIYNTSNVGYARGNNIGLKFLEKYNCTISIISNPDSHFEECTVNEIINVFENNNKYGILTTRRVMENGKEKIRQYWSIPTYLDLVIENFTLYCKFIKNKREIYEPEDMAVYDISVAPGAFFAIRNDVLRQIDYLDENTFLYFEENCLASKLLKTKYKIGFIPYVSYVVLDRKKNSTSKLRKTISARKYYVESKEYFASKYLRNNFLMFLLLKITDGMFLLEKKIQLILSR